MANSSVRQIEYKGISIDVERKKVKNLYLRVLPDGQVRFTLPRQTSWLQAEAFLESKIKWIEEKKAACALHRAQAIPLIPHNMASGATILLFGTCYQLELSEGNVAAYLIDSERRLFHLTVKPGADPTQSLLKAYKEILFAVLGELCRLGCNHQPDL